MLTYTYLYMYRLRVAVPYVVFEMLLGDTDGVANKGFQWSRKMAYRPIMAYIDLYFNTID